MRVVWGHPRMITAVFTIWIASHGRPPFYWMANPWKRAKGGDSRRAVPLVSILRKNDPRGLTLAQPWRDQ